MSVEDLKKLVLPTEIVDNILAGTDISKKRIVLDYLLVVSGHDDGHTQFLRDTVFDNLFSFIEHGDSTLADQSLKCLINVSSNILCAEYISKLCGRLLPLCLAEDSIFGGDACKVLANITRHETIANVISKFMIGNSLVRQVISAINDTTYNKHVPLDHLSLVVGNLSQCKEFTSFLLEQPSFHLVKVLPIINHSKSALERYGAASTVYNCLFDSSTHEKLLEPPFEILPALLLPLAGPEEFDISEYDKLPTELQYLPTSKTREQDPSVRNILLRAILHLCTTQKVRCIVRECNTYLILREYHKWETEGRNLLVVENIINFLIRTEEEIGVEDISKVDYPEHLAEKFDKLDEDFMEDCSIK